MVRSRRADLPPGPAGGWALSVHRRVRADDAGQRSPADDYSRMLGSPDARKQPSQLDGGRGLAAFVKDGTDRRGWLGNMAIGRQPSVSHAKRSHRHRPPAEAVAPCHARPNRMMLLFHKVPVSSSRISYRAASTIARIRFGSLSENPGSRPSGLPMPEYCSTTLEPGSGSRRMFTRYRDDVPIEVHEAAKAEYEIHRAIRNTREVVAVVPRIAHVVLSADSFAWLVKEHLMVIDGVYTPGRQHVPRPTPAAGPISTIVACDEI